MYLPASSSSIPAAAATATASASAVLTRQLSGLTPPYEKNGNPFDHDPTGIVNTPDSTQWYGAVWVVPVAWALTFYCVASLLLLCALYGQGVVDGKLDYIPRHLRQRGRVVAAGGSAYPDRRRGRSVARSSVAHSDTGTLIDYAVDVHGARDSHAGSHLSNISDRYARASITSESRDEHALFARYTRRPEGSRDLHQSVQRQMLVQQLVRESEREGAERGGSAGGEERPESRQTRDLARRLEVARIESALAAAGVL